MRSTASVNASLERLEARHSIVSASVPEAELLLVAINECAVDRFFPIIPDGRRNAVLLQEFTNLAVRVRNRVPPPHLHCRDLHRGGESGGESDKGFDSELSSQRCASVRGARVNAFSHIRTARCPINEKLSVNRHPRARNIYMKNAFHIIAPDESLLVASDESLLVDQHLGFFFRGSGKKVLVEQ